MAVNYGTSNPIKIGGEEFSSLGDIHVSPAAGEDINVLPPATVDDGTIPSVAMTENINPYGCLAFPKVCPPLYGKVGSIAEITGIPANRPDFVADHHWIPMMRLVDLALRHKYKGTIIGKYDTPGPTG